MSTEIAHAYRELPLDQVAESTWNPRKSFDPVKLDELARSIAEKGVIEPIVVRPVTKKAAPFEIVAGARRYRGATMAKLTTIPAIVRELDDVAALELAVIENDQRDDVNPMEAAEGYQALITAGKGYTPASIAKKLGKVESYVVRRLKLNGLDSEFKNALREGRLSLGHAEKLLRLTPAQRKDAQSRNVIWAHSPLLDSSEKWVPQVEDLQPLHELEEFIREKSHFDPASPDARHLMPKFGQQLELAESQVGEAAANSGDDEWEDPDSVAATLVELTLDSMARARMGLTANAPMPLTPSKWKEIKNPKNACAFAVRGVITQGTARYGQILTVCTKKSCKTHWPVAKKAKATSQPKTAAPKQESWEERQKREDQERAKAKAISTAILDAALPLLAKHTAKTKFSAALVRTVIDHHDLDRVEKSFGVKLSDNTAAQVLLLSVVRTSPTYYGEITDFRRDCKDLKFNLGAIEEQVKKQLAGEAKAAKQTKSAKPSKGAK
jgi:ParB/RepB/Spo0J family partition protein